MIAGSQIAVEEFAELGSATKGDRIGKASHNLVGSLEKVIEVETREVGVRGGGFSRSRLRLCLRVVIGNLRQGESDCGIVCLLARSFWGSRFNWLGWGLGGCATGSGEENFLSGLEVPEGSTGWHDSELAIVSLNGDGSRGLAAGINGLRDFTGIGVVSEDAAIGADQLNAFEDGFDGEVGAGPIACRGSGGSTRTGDEDAVGVS